MFQIPRLPQSSGLKLSIMMTKVNEEAVESFMKPFMTSFPDNADFSKIMQSSLEKGCISVLYLPKHYERSERKKNKSRCQYNSRID
jgi:hypothetical protein